MTRGKIAAMIVALAVVSGCAQAAREPVDPQPATPLTYQNPAYQKVTPEAAKKMMDAGVTVIDVRESNEYAQGHIAGAVNVPLSTLKQGEILQAAPDVEKPLLVHCRSGVRAEKAAKILVESGYQHVFNMYGTMQWPYGLVQ